MIKYSKCPKSLLGGILATSRLRRLVVKILEQNYFFELFSKNWQGEPLADVQTAVDLIGSTRTTTGLEVICVRDDTEYQLAK